MNSIHAAPVDAEQALLGWALNGNPIDDIPLGPSDFYQPWHGHVWRACQVLADRGEKPHPISVRRMLDGITCPTGDAGVALVELIEHAAIGDPSQVVELVDAAAARRRLSDVAARLQQLAESDRDPDELADLAQGLLSERRTRSNLRMLGDRFETVTDTLEQQEPRGWPTPWPDLDAKLGGWHPGRLYVVGARPAQGKSIIGMQSAVYAARRYGKAAFIASMEMPHDELVLRTISDVASVSQSAIQARTLTERDWQKIAQAQDTITRLPIIVDDSAPQTLATIRAGAREAAKRHDLGLVVVDYLQLISARDQRIGREQQVAEISRGLKLLSRELDVAVIALAQLNRGAKDKPPTMENLRESGAIEAAADVVILLHREDQYDDTTVMVEKNRHGSTGQFPLSLWGHYSRFEQPQTA